MSDIAPALNSTKPARFCSQCGQLLSRANLPTDNRPRDICGACGTIHYQNPRVLVACLVDFDSKLILCRRAIAPAQGLWFLPSGFMEKDEALEAAAARELVEETGIAVSSASCILYCVLSIPRLSEVYLIYRVTLANAPTLSAGVESSEVALFSADECPSDLAFPDFFRGFLATYFRDAERGHFPVRAQTLDSGDANAQFPLKVGEFPQFP